MSYISNRPRTAPRQDQWYATASDLKGKGFPVVDGVPIPIEKGMLGQSMFIDSWRCEFDGTKAKTANPNGELGYYSGKYRDDWKIIKKGIEIGDCYWNRTSSKSGDGNINGNRYEDSRPMTHPTKDYRVVGNRFGSFSGVRRYFGEDNTLQWVIDRQQIYSNQTGRITYKKVNGNVVESTRPQVFETKEQLHTRVLAHLKEQQKKTKVKLRNFLFHLVGIGVMT